MSHVVGIYAREASAGVARDLLMDAGYFGDRVVLLGLKRRMEDVLTPRLRHRGESMVRAALRWGIIGALITEIPLVIALFIVPLDVNVKVLLASTVWKFGAAFGAWIGAMAASDRGLDPELADRYEGLLNDGKWVLSADVRSGDRSYARGLMLESDALEIRDVYGTFELKSSAHRPVPQAFN